MSPSSLFSKTKWNITKQRSPPPDTHIHIFLTRKVEIFWISVIRGNWIQNSISHLPWNWSKKETLFFFTLTCFINKSHLNKFLLTLIYVHLTCQHYKWKLNFIKVSTLFILTFSNTPRGLLHLLFQQTYFLLYFFSYVWKHDVYLRLSLSLYKDSKHHFQPSQKKFYFMR